MTTYEQHILRILSEVGPKGISLGLLAKHVYNLSSGLFTNVVYDDVYRVVQQYLLSHSVHPRDLVERMEKRGYYRLNASAGEAAHQLILCFSTDNEEEEELLFTSSLSNQDTSLSLFNFDDEENI
ncbi:MAG: hypothetical protein KIG89_06375 [Prevotella sp.]|nr:hypothetical protein [Prevotella sp.]